MIARNGGRHGEQERDCGTNGRGPQRPKGDLSGEKDDDAHNCTDCNRCDRPRTGVIGGKSCCDAGELCGVPRYVAHAQQAFLWSMEGGFLRHIFWRG
jgi:hypothetical protein